MNGVYAKSRMVFSLELQGPWSRNDNDLEEIRAPHAAVHLSRLLESEP